MRERERERERERKDSSKNKNKEFLKVTFLDKDFKIRKNKTNTNLGSLPF